MAELAPPRHRPVRIAPDTWVIQEVQGEGVAPLCVHINSMVIKGREPVLVDTGSPRNRERWLEDAWSLVDPADVRWVFLSHDDADHYGNLGVILDACPNATVVSSFFLGNRLECELPLPLARVRWLNDGEAFDAGDRTLVAVTPPIYDSPTTRGLFDTRTGVYWAVDAFGAFVPGGTADAADLDPVYWADTFTAFNRAGAPWLDHVDERRWRRTVDRVEALGVELIASAHGPTVSGANVAKAFDLTRALPSTEAPPAPVQADLEARLAELLV